MSFIKELKRRNVIRVAIAYAVAAWLLIEFSATTFPMLRLPEWTATFVTVLVIIGFPLALIFAWAYELTPEGLKKEKDVDRSESITHITGRKLDFVIIGALVMALGYFVWERQSLLDPTAAEPEPVAEQLASEAPEVSVEAGAAAQRRSIAVLPFLYLSSDKEQEWFADGLSEEILNSLARTPDLLVAARTSSFTFKGSNEDIPTIAKALGVEHILEGSVRRSGDRLRVTAQLVRANDGFHLWSESYDRNLDDLIDIQENVAIEIANALETAMDPKALALMVSSGTSSVPAFEAYLQGLAYGVSTVATGDIYEFLSARDAFEQAIELDPEFARAYWELAAFWQTQLSATNIVSGITDLSPAEMLPLYEDAINKAIKYDKDPLSGIGYRADKAHSEMKFRQALRLNTDYLEQRPNDQLAQSLQLTLLAQQSMHDKAAEAIAEFYERDGYDAVVTVDSLFMLLSSGDREAIRTFADNAVERFSDNAFVLYQAHRALLWVGDIDGASKILPIVQSSDMPERNRYLVSLRQACAENSLADATRLHTSGHERFADDISIVWLGHLIMGNEEEAVDALMELDERQDLTSLTDFLSYGTFDPRPYPNLMALLEGQGIERGEVIELPYRCRR